MSFKLRWFKELNTSGDHIILFVQSYLKIHRQLYYYSIKFLYPGVIQYKTVALKSIPGSSTWLYFKLNLRLWCCMNDPQKQQWMVFIHRVTLHCARWQQLVTCLPQDFDSMINNIYSFYCKCAQELFSKYANMKRLIFANTHGLETETKSL